MLAAWWRDEQLPSVERLSTEQARYVLNRIAELDWSCRPFEEAG